MREQQRLRREMFVPLHHEPGHAQADFGEALVVIGGIEQKAHFFALDLPHSDASYIRAYPAATAEASTGSLIAPFAFLGPAYDPQLRAVYTAIQPPDIFEKRSLLTAVFHESFADTTPLYRLISRYVDEAMMVAIAREYSKGRLLLIGTTNLDVERPVIL